MNVASKLSTLCSQIFLVLILSYLAYHCCTPATDVLSRRIVRRITKDIELFEAGSNSIDTVTQLSGGLSGTRLYKVTIDKVSFVVRQIANRSKYDRQREVAAQQRASKGGWGPHVYYADTKKGLIVMQYIASDQSLNGIPVAEKMQKLATLLKKIHTGTCFKYCGSVIEEMNTSLRTLGYQEKNGIKSGYFSSELQAKLMQVLDQIKQIQKELPTSSFIHRDLNPNNMIVHGGDIFVIDFESAVQDDPYFDVATVGVFNVFDAQDEQLYLSTYFGRAPTQREYAKYQIMKKAVYLFYGLAMITRTPVDFIEHVENALPLMSVFQNIGTVYDLSKAEHRRIFGLSLLREALRV